MPATGAPLPFADGTFDLVLSGHLAVPVFPQADGGVFNRSPCDLAWHRRVLAELLRVSCQELLPLGLIRRVTFAYALQGSARFFLHLKHLHAIVIIFYIRLVDMPTATVCHFLNEGVVD